MYFQLISLLKLNIVQANPRGGSDNLKHQTRLILDYLNSSPASPQNFNYPGQSEFTYQIDTFKPHCKWHIQAKYAGPIKEVLVQGDGVPDDTTEILVICGPVRYPGILTDASVSLRKVNSVTFPQNRNYWGT